MKKKVLSVVLASAMVLSLAACGNSADTAAAPADTTAETTEATAETTEPAADPLPGPTGIS